MSTRGLCLSLIALLAGCTTGRLPSTSFAEPAALEQAMKRYYEAHATEQYGYCSTPYIDGLTQVQVVDNQPQRLVIDVRYLYRDWQKNGEQRIRPTSAPDTAAAASPSARARPAGSTSSR